MRPIPSELRSGPFTRAEARELGVADRQLDGTRFVRVFPRVFRSADHEMSDEDWVAAARLTLPDDAHLTGITRIPRLGLEYGPRRPIRFVVDRDLHLVLDEIFLHRTARLPPTDDVGVTVPAAFIAYSARTRVIDAIKVGDWLIRQGHLAARDVVSLALAAPWRDGAHEAVWVLDHLDGRSRSLKESETRAVLAFAGLPTPEVNAAVAVRENVEVIGDLVYRHWTLVVEYEGAQHQEDREQYVADLDRYGLMRGADVRYVQVTKERLARPQTLVGEVYRALLAGGYDGPAPKFDGPVATAVLARLGGGRPATRPDRRASGELTTERRSPKVDRTPPTRRTLGGRCLIQRTLPRKGGLHTADRGVSSAAPGAGTAGSAPRGGC